MSRELNTEFRHLNGSGMIAGRGTTTTHMKLPPGFEARHVVLNRQAWERVGLISVTLAGFEVHPFMRRVGDSKVLDLPETDNRGPRELAIEWTNASSRAYHLPYRVTEEPQGEVERPVPATLRAIAPEPEPQIDTGPPSELEEQLSASFRVPVLRLRSIVQKLAQRYDLTVPELLEFFGPDGYSTIPEDQIAIIGERAGKLSLNAAELLVAATFQGVATTMSERRDVERLMVAGGARDDRPRTDDFLVTTKVHAPPAPPAPSAEAPTKLETPVAKEAIPEADAARINELARWMKVPPQWLVPVLKTIADLRGQSVHELAYLLNLPMVTALRQMFIGVVSAPDDPIVKQASKLATDGYEHSASLELNQAIAVRSIDSVAEGKRQGRF